VARRPPAAGRARCHPAPWGAVAERRLAETLRTRATDADPAAGRQEHTAPPAEPPNRERDQQERDREPEDDFGDSWRTYRERADHIRQTYRWTVTEPPSRAENWLPLGGDDDHQHDEPPDRSRRWLRDERDPTARTADLGCSRFPGRLLAPVPGLASGRAVDLADQLEHLPGHPQRPRLAGPGPPDYDGPRHPRLGGGRAPSRPVSPRRWGGGPGPGVPARVGTRTQSCSLRSVADEPSRTRWTSGKRSRIINLRSRVANVRSRGARSRGSLMVTSRSVQDKTGLWFLIEEVRRIAGLTKLASEPFGRYREVAPPCGFAVKEGRSSLGHIREQGASGRRAESWLTES
jgi:hypothetical protein